MKPLGVTDTQPARPIGLRVADARHHLHVLGATGSGKSTLLAQLILDDAARRPRGGAHRPQRRPGHRPARPPPPPLCGPVVLLDPDSRARPPGLNPLDPPPDPHDATRDDPTTADPARAAADGIGAGRRWRWRTWSRCSAASTPRSGDPAPTTHARRLPHPPATPGVATLADIPNCSPTPPSAPAPPPRSPTPSARVLALVRRLSDPAKAQASHP